MICLVNFCELIIKLFAKAINSINNFQLMTVFDVLLIEFFNNNCKMSAYLYKFITNIVEGIVAI